MEAAVLVLGYMVSTIMGKVVMQGLQRCALFYPLFAWLLRSTCTIQGEGAIFELLIVKNRENLMLGM